MLRKAVLTRNWSKKHIEQNLCKRDTTPRKADCPFDAVAVLEVKGWKFCLQDENHNHEPILAGAHQPIERSLETRKYESKLLFMQGQGLLHSKHPLIYVWVMMRKIGFLKVRTFTMEDNVFERLGLMD